MKASEAIKLSEQAYKAANITKALENIYSNIKQEAEKGYTSAFFSNPFPLELVKSNKLRNTLTKNGYLCKFCGTYLSIEWGTENNDI